MAKLDDQISTLQERLTQLKLRQQRVDARQRAAEATRERKKELRRRILVGALILEKTRAGEMDAALLERWLEESLTGTADRELFQLTRKERSREGSTEPTRSDAVSGAASSEGSSSSP